MAARKTMTETAKDTLKSVDRKVSDKLVDTINVGEPPTAKAAEAVTGKATEANYKATGTAEEIRGKMKAESEELAAKAKSAAKTAEGKIKGNL
ncbi:hypothetical protein ONZ43_g5046 [Nemania bipapillata]|uniref:Uncharacterized protein n=1 Tax=Nemania bipapillata TaxID=110536 RepID=A0ACC2IFK4_9PEZI|nr:hypothetical protein ONZ43_g5046 [Nemania bipapillata]